MNCSLIVRSLLFLVGVLVLSGCGQGQPEETDSNRAPSTRVMAQELQEIAASADPQMNPYANQKRVESLKREPLPDDPVERTSFKYRLGREQLRAGDTREAIKTLQEVARRMVKTPQRYNESQARRVKKTLGLAWLRLGEQENCLLNHTSKSCILPIQGEGLHEKPEGSRNAIKYFGKFLEQYPNRLNTRWLLNIAYMTLGEYPDGVPSEWFIPLDRTESDVEVPPFPDIAPQLGLDVMDLSGGTVVEDFSGNGYLDILISSWHLDDQVRFFENNGDGTFTEKTEEAGLKGITGGLNLRHADYTNNGSTDVLVLRGAWRGAGGTYPNSLLRNDGDGTFTDVTREAGIYERLPTQTAAWGDFNNDGAVDLFVGNESTDAQEAPSSLYRNDGDGSFTPIADQMGVDVKAFVKGVTWGDYNNDGYQDLYVSVLGGDNRLFRNEGPGEGGEWSFTNVAEDAGVNEPEQSFPVWFWDYNNDGHLDLFVSGYQIGLGDVAREYLGEPLTHTTLPRLYRNNGDGTFTDVADDANLDKVLYSMGSNYGELNNDGNLDFYVGTGDPDFRSLMPSRMFLNQSGHRFAEVTLSGHFGNIQKGHAVAFADFNHNGRQDIYMNMGGALVGDTYQNLFFKNPGFEKNWLAVRLVGTESNRSGIGARVKAVVRTGDSTRALRRVVGSGSSFGGNPFRVHLGLGEAEVVDRLVVTWPAADGRQVFTDVAANQHIRVREGAEEVSPLDVSSFSYPGDDTSSTEAQAPVSAGMGTDQEPRN